MFGLGPSELVIVGIVAILLFGKRLPEVAKSFGKSYRQFREGLSEFHSHIDITSMDSGTSSSRRSAPSAPRDYDDYEEATAPKFDPPPAEPTTVQTSSATAEQAPSSSFTTHPPKAD